MRVDSHQHFWRLDRGDYGWLTDGTHPKIAHDLLPADLAPLLSAARIDKTILVQAAPTQDETRFLLDLAVATPFVAGVVGWIDFEASDAPARIARLCAHPKLVGLRPMLQDIADEEWILNPAFAVVFDAMARGGLRFDALVQPRHLPALAELTERYPDLPLVIDHAAKPDLAHLAPWATYIRHIAAETNTYCKLSGLATLAGPGWSAATLEPVFAILLDAFGAERLMWGSDWPVLNEAGDYASWLGATMTLTAQLSSSDREAIFGGTASAFYGVG